MDKRIKTINREKDRTDREALYRDLALGHITIGEAVKRMRKLSKLTQPEFAKHRGISTAALRQIESNAGNPTIDTLNKVAQIFGLHVGFVPNALRAANIQAQAGEPGPLSPMLDTDAGIP